MKKTETILYITGGIATAAIIGYFTYKILMKNKGADKETIQVQSNEQNLPVDTITPANIPGAVSSAPKPSTSTLAPKLPDTWQKVQLKFPDGVPFSASVMTGKINIQIPSLSVNKTWLLTTQEQDSINLALAKGTSIQEAVTAWMYKRKLTSALAVKNSK